MKMMKSLAHFSVHVELEPPINERVIVIQVGDVVDFEDVVRPAKTERRKGLREELTLAGALAEHVKYFVPAEDEPTAAPAPSVAAASSKK